MAKEDLESNEFVQIAKAICVILLVIIIFFVALAKEMMVSVLPSIVWGFVVFGIFLSLFTYKSQKNK